MVGGHQQLLALLLQVVDFCTPKFWYLLQAGISHFRILFYPAVQEGALGMSCSMLPTCKEKSPATAFHALCWIVLVMQSYVVIGKLHKKN